MKYFDYSKFPLISVDIETSDPNLETKGNGVYRKDGKILGVAFSNGEISEYYPLNSEKNLFYIKDQLKSNNNKIFANALYDLDWLENFQGIKVNGKIEDVQIAEPLIDEYRRSYSLGSLGEKYLGENKKSKELDYYAMSQGWKGPGIKHLDKMPLELVSKYACQDVKLTFNIYIKQRSILKEQNLIDIYNLEIGLFPLLLQMRKIGVRIDTERLYKAESLLKEMVYDYQKEIDKVCGPVNVGSNLDMKRLFKKLNLPIEYDKPTLLMIKKGKKQGNPKFDKNALKKIEHPVIKKILELRQMKTLLNFFFLPYPELLVNDRLHCNFNQLRSDTYGTVSGRFSSSNPNLQQVSGKDFSVMENEILSGKIVRKLFLPEQDHNWLKFDWSQIEYRLIAHYSLGPGSDAIRKRYNDNPDVDYHDELGKMTGIIDRRTVKSLNFGAGYGMGVSKMALLYGWDLSEAKAIYSLYHKKVPFIRTTMERVGLKAKRVGYIKTLLNRRARVPESGKLYVMFNRLIQGSAADLMKKAMLDAYNAGVFSVLKPHLTVHDELDCSKPKTKEGLDAGKELKNIMETCIKLKIPIKVDAEIGENWGELEKWNN